jgi:hypothetical protein
MTKSATLLLRLQAGWSPAPDLCTEFGWKPHTLRAALCGLPLPSGGKIERRRESGITSYRIAQEMPSDDGQPSEMQEWQDYDREC